MNGPRKPNGIRTVLFDLGNVLVRFSHERMFQQISDVSGLPADRLREVLVTTGLQWQFERGFVTEAQFHQQLEAIAERSIPIDALRRASADIFTPQHGIDEVVARLSRQGRRLVLLSNTCVTHFRWVRDHFAVLNLFDDFVLSFEVGALKPERAIFESAVERIDCDPSECFYTDDIDEHVQMGRAMGLVSDVFIGVDELKRRLRELRAA